jgi:succinate dehydrogenase/fumarate reductase flavoprotein subunit
MTVAGGSVVASCAPNVSGTPISSDTTQKVAETSNKLSFEIPPAPIPDSQINETKEAEIIVIGAGTSGLCTALSAAEAGAKVILFAKGKGPIGRGGSNFAVYSKYMESLKLPKLEAEPFLRNQLMACSFNVDTDKWYKWYNHSEEAMNWLIDHMSKTNYEIHLEQGNRGMDPSNPAYCPPGTHAWISADMRKVGDGQPFVVETLAKDATAAGVEIIYQMDAQQLIRENNNTGRVTAVIAKDENGKYVKFKGSKAIVMATGDFSADEEMMTKYCPHMVKYTTNIGKDVDPENGKVYGGLFKGQGQKMGLWVGAAWQKTYPNAPMKGSFGGASNMPYNMPSGLIVNSNGERFFCEEITSGYMSNLIFQQPGESIFQIWDAGYAESGQPWWISKTGYGDEPTPPDQMIAKWDDNVEKKTMVKADTLEELIKVMGLPATTLDEIKKYNGFCASGKDTDFYKRAELLKPIEKGPFYGATIKGTTVLTVLGGLRTNINMQVCQDDDTPIPGLYNVGTMIGDAFADTYSFQIAGHNLGMNCVTFGYLTGRYIANNA